MNDRDLRIAMRFKKLVERKVSAHRFILYGSRASGNASPDSDLDILIAVDELTPEISAYISDCAWEAGFEELIHVSPIVYRFNELMHGPQSASIFVQTVLKEGLPL